MDQLIYKVVSRELWESCEDSFAGAGIDLADGYIHFSTAAQVVETVRKHFAGQTDLVLVSVSGKALGDDLRWEVSRGGDLFPHLYAELPMSAVIAVQDLPLGPGGHHTFPAEF